jgi:hypothetical protein
MPRRSAPYCRVCKDEHMHYSSAGLRLQQKGQQDSRMLVISDSTLFNCWTCREEMKPDLEVHNGATVKDLTEIVTKYYINSKKPIKIIMFAGLNDLAKNRGADKILDDIHELKSQVKEANENSVISVSTVPLVPKFCSLNVNLKNKGSFYDLPECKNKINEFEALNAGIAALNRGDNLKTIPVHNVGVIGKGIGKKRNKVHRKDDKPNYFIEDGIIKKKMHLTYIWRFKFYKQACDYLVKGLEMS